MEGLSFDGVELRLVNCFLRCIDEKHYSKITVKEISEMCAITRTEFYRHFSDLLDMLDRIERDLLNQLHLYVGKWNHRNTELPDNPFACTERWFEKGLALRPVIRRIMGSNGDRYFKERLLAQVRRELNVMMNDDKAPNDRLRPYYVAMTAAAHIELLHYLALQDVESIPVSAHELAIIANSARVAYYRGQVLAGAPFISDEQLYGGQR